jgi:hypothetical protein
MGEIHTLTALKAEANGPLRAILNILIGGIFNVSKSGNGRLRASIYSLDSLGTTAPWNASAPEDPTTNHYAK